MPKRRRLLHVLLLFLLQSLVTSRTVYTIIDDTYGDEKTNVKPTYFPSTGVWDNSACGREQGCAIVPDPSSAMLGTWSAATYRPSRQDKISVLFNFQGTGISVFLIVVNNLGRSGLTTATECNFTLDGQLARQYSHNPSSLAGLQYREEAFAVSGLSNSSHLLEISAGGLNHEVYLNFDYANYTYEILDSEPNPVQSSSKTPVAAIVGGTVGGVAFLVAVVATFYICRRKRQRPQPIPATPFAIENPQTYPTFTVRPPDPRVLQAPLSHSMPETRLSYPSTIQNQSFSTGSSQFSEKPPRQQTSEMEYVELNRHAHNMREELRSLTSQTWSASSATGSDSNTTVQALRDEIRLMQEQLDQIRQQQVPPPGYTS